MRLRSVLTLLIVLTILLTGTSCSVSLFPGYRNDNTLNAFTPVPWFGSDTNYYLFNANIDLMKNHYSGLMVVKNVGTDTFRVVLITEVGLKVLDFEFFPDREARVHYIMDPLNKKMLISTLSKDISLVLMNQIKHKEPAFLMDKERVNRIVKYKNNGKKNYYFFKPDSVMPYSAIQTGSVSKRVKAAYFGTGQRIDSVIISHYNVNLNIKLYRISEDHVDE